MFSRLASTSHSKSSSTGGALFINSRQRAAEMTWGPRAGRSWATGTPLRTTSTSSPAPTLLITCENLLATSVAVRLIMFRRYQINLIPCILLGSKEDRIGVDQRSVVRLVFRWGYSETPRTAGLFSFQGRLPAGSCPEICPEIAPEKRRRSGSGVDEGDTMPTSPSGPVGGHLLKVERRRGAQWYAGFRLPDGHQAQGRIGPRAGAPRVGSWRGPA